MSDYDILAIDTVVNPHTPEIVAMRPGWGKTFHQETFHRDASVAQGYDYEQMIAMLHDAGTERAFLVANKTGQIGLPGSWHLPYEMVNDAVQRFPVRFTVLSGTTRLILIRLDSVISLTVLRAKCSERKPFCLDYGQSASKVPPSCPHPTRSKPMKN